MRIHTPLTPYFGLPQALWRFSLNKNRRWSLAADWTGPLYRIWKLNTVVETGMPLATPWLLEAVPESRFPLFSSFHAVMLGSCVPSGPWIMQAIRVLEGKDHVAE
jgi:hypothetical protein